jgi:uncharacterized protein DUF955
VPHVVDVKLLNRLDRLIARHKLHAGDPCQPVYVETLLDREPVTTYFGALSRKVQAYTTRWQRGVEKFTDITLSIKLREPSKTAIRRHAFAHEYAHVICKHQGDYFIMWEAQRGVDAMECLLHDTQEKQCEYVAAYLLVPRLSLFQLANEDAWYIARVLDVPLHLVELRWEVYRKFGR